jgi:hypothetical protein
MYRTLAFLACAAMLPMAGCTDYGTVEQGRVIGYNKKTGQVILIRDSTGGQVAKPVYDALPPITVQAPGDPDEMGPDPQAGKLMRVDMKNHQLVIYDAAGKQFRTIPYTLLGEPRTVAKGTGLPAIDKSKQTITIYNPAQHLALTIAATDELLAMPADTWKTGDEIRYYFRDPAQALRMMNVTRTDLNKS